MNTLSSEAMAVTTDQPACRENPHSGLHCLHDSTDQMRSGAIFGYQRCCWCGGTFNRQMVFAPEHGPHEHSFGGRK
jgi:hypothetical protein